MNINKIKSAAKFPISYMVEAIVRNRDWSDCHFFAILKIRKSRSDRKTENELEPEAPAGVERTKISSIAEMTPIIPSKHINGSLSGACVDIHVQMSYGFQK
jgi:hypothetical protein